jgi:hypothetical protein
MTLVCCYHCTPIYLRLNTLSFSLSLSLQVIWCCFQQFHLWHVGTYYLEDEDSLQVHWYLHHRLRRHSQTCSRVLSLVAVAPDAFGASFCFSFENLSLSGLKSLWLLPMLVLFRLPLELVGRFYLLRRYCYQQPIPFRIWSLRGGAVIIPPLFLRQPSSFFTLPLA